MLGMANDEFEFVLPEDSDSDRASWRVSLAAGLAPIAAVLSLMSADWMRLVDVRRGCFGLREILALLTVAVAASALVCGLLVHVAMSKRSPTLARLLLWLGVASVATGVLTGSRFLTGLSANDMFAVVLAAAFAHLLVGALSLTAFARHRRGLALMAGGPWDDDATAVLLREVEQRAVREASADGQEALYFDSATIAGPLERASDLGVAVRELRGFQREGATFRFVEEQVFDGADAIDEDFEMSVVLTCTLARGVLDLAPSDAGLVWRIRLHGRNE
jgi:hypothetical protein